MNKTRLLTFLTALAILGARPSFGEVSIGVNWNEGIPHRRYERYPYGYRRPFYHHRVVAVEPVVVAPSPYYVPQAVVAAPPPVTTGDYGNDLGNLTGRLASDRTLINRQVQKGGITRAQYNNEMNALEEIEHDEHERTYEQGRLSENDLAELSSRLDAIEENIQADMAE